MKIKKVLKPGQPGTKKYLDQFGEQLVCVRYRYDTDTQKRIITVEVVIEKDDWIENPHKKARNKKTFLRIGYEETYLRRVVKSAGGKWNTKLKVWELPFGEVVNLGLQKRITNVNENDRNES